MKIITYPSKSGYVAVGHGRCAIADTRHEAYAKVYAKLIDPKYQKLLAKVKLIKHI